jgi:hypothetical protein
VTVQINGQGMLLKVIDVNGTVRESHLIAP